jgi:hypothetical protein
MKAAFTLILKSLLAAAPHAATLGMLFLTACATAPRPMPVTAIDRAPPQLLSAFFGLDNGLVGRTRRICREAPGSDGMPVILSHRIAASATGRLGRMDPTVFEVELSSGERLAPACAALAPALDASERHTVLLIGEFGSEEDPPVEVAVVGSIPLDGGADARGLSATVTPLEAGPELILAFRYGPDDLETDCPRTTQQVVVVAWAGGVTLAEGRSEEDHRTMYQVETEAGPVTPDALADLGDNDNYEHLCLSEAANPVRVRAEPGVLLDPRGDPNVETTVGVSG